MQPITIGLRVRLAEFDPNASGVASVALLADLAKRIEQAGADALFVAPHPVSLDHGGVGIVHDGDAFVALGACAATTSTMVLACCPRPADGRLPAVISKVATALDVLTKGHALTVFDATVAMSTRDLEELGEQIEIVRAMAHVRAPSYRGKYFTITQAWNEPRAPGRPMPLGLFLSDGPWVSANGDDAAMIAADLAARYCDYLIVAVKDTSDGSLEQMVGDFTKRARRAGRVPGSVHLLALVAVSSLGDAPRVIDIVQRCRSVGFDGAVIDVDEVAGNEQAIGDLVGALARVFVALA